MNPSLWFFLLKSEYMELELRLVELQGAQKVGRRALHPCGQGVGPLLLILSPIFFIYSKTYLREFSGQSEYFLFCTKNNTMAILVETASVRVSSIQTMQVRFQNKGKRVWKVDTMEMYQWVDD